MTNAQVIAVTMLLRVQQIFAKYKTLFEAYKPLQKLMAAYEATMTTLDADIKAQAGAVPNNTENKDTIKRKAFKLTVPLAYKAHDWAIEHKMQDLEELFDVNSSYFSSMDEIDAAALAENIIEAIDDNLESMTDYNITNAQIEEAAATILKFKKLIGSPQVVQTNNKVLSTNISGDISNAKKTLKRCDKLVSAEFKINQPQAYHEYIDARFQGSSIRQHTALAVTVTDAAHHFVPNAIVSITAIKRSDETDETGVAEIIKFKAGSYSVSVKADGFKDATFDFVAKMGKKTELEIVLEKA